MTTTRVDLAGIHVPLITPFESDGRIATDALEQLAHQVLSEGCGRTRCAGDYSGSRNTHRAGESDRSGYLCECVPCERRDVDRRRGQ